MRLYLYIQANASKTEIIGELEVEAINYGSPQSYLKATKVKLKAKPVDGAANNELLECLAKHFGLSKNSLRIIKGEKSKYKVVEFA